MGTDLPVAFRAGERGDVAYVADSWRRSYGDADRARADDVSTYVRTQNQVIDEALRTSEVLVAHWPDHPAQIIGWCCYRGPATVHYLYVKRAFRRRGYGRAIVAEVMTRLRVPTRVFVTHTWNGLPQGAAMDALTATERASLRIYYNPALIFA